MEHVCSYESCGRPLKYGEEVVQMLQGICNLGFITPAFATLIAEWHVDCFHEFVLEPQGRPYRCQSCNKPIEGSDHVNFFVKGMETTPGYTVAEGRGYEIYSVRHVNC
jgi:hypothetical protein